VVPRRRRRIYYPVTKRKIFNKKRLCDGRLSVELVKCSWVAGLRVVGRALEVWGKRVLVFLQQEYGGNELLRGRMESGVFFVS
jgi:hypothetical protein